MAYPLTKEILEVYDAVRVVDPPTYEEQISIHDDCLGEIRVAKSDGYYLVKLICGKEQTYDRSHLKLLIDG